MSRNSLGSSTEGHKSNLHRPQSNLRYGIGGRGETLSEERKRFLYYKGEDGKERNIIYFVNHKGLYDEGVLEIKKEDDKEGIRRTYVKSSDGKWYEYYDFISEQVKYSVKRGYGRISWPNVFCDVSLEEYLNFTKEEVRKALESFSECR